MPLINISGSSVCVILKGGTSSISHFLSKSGHEISLKQKSYGRKNGPELLFLRKKVEIYYDFDGSLIISRMIGAEAFYGDMAF